METSENSGISKTSSEEYNATCISCGSVDGIQLWPHRNGHGNLIGFVFACAGCQDIVRGVTLEIHGIRGRDVNDEESNPWINASEGLPDDMRDVMTYSAEFGINTACHQGGQEGDPCWWSNDVPHAKFKESVVMWREITPPTSGEEDGR